MFHKFTKVATNVGDSPANVPQIHQNARANNALATKLALEVPRTSNLSEFPLRFAFARAMLRSSRSPAQTPEILLSFGALRKLTFSRKPTVKNN